ncbi:Uncharacterised protein [Sphingomonas paucimobilis]|nr:Uncharacterised protein [Sphingomonas paucimobilis]
MTPDPTVYPIDHVLRGAGDALALLDREGGLSFAEAETMVARLADGWRRKASRPARG